MTEEDKQAALAKTAPAPDSEKQDVLSVRDTGSRALAALKFEPRDAGELIQFSEYFAKTGLFGVKTGADVFARVMIGAPLGLSFAQCIKLVYSFESQGSVKAGIYAEGIRALCESRKDVFEIFRLVPPTPERPGDKIAVLLVKRPGEEPIEVTYTIEEARTAGLVKKDSNWEKVPSDMLVARVTTRASRRYGARVTSGIDSVEDIRDAELVGTVVHNGEPAQHRATIVDTGRSASAYEAELQLLKEQIDAAKTPADGRTVREAIEIWDATAALKDRAMAYYNEHAEKMRRAKAEKRPAEPQGSLPVT